MTNTYREGQFVWRELMTSDVQKSRGFYGELFGWTYKEWPTPQGSYWLASKGETTMAGMMGLPPGASFPPNWMSYVSVKDVDATLAAVAAHGGQKMMVEDVPEVGRIGVLVDPQGAALGVMRSTTGDDPAPGMPVPGTFCWETLNTTDVAKAKAFYTGVFGWTVGTGPGNNMGVFNAGSCQVADVEPAPPNVPAHWLLHVVVEELEDARSRAEKLGASVMMGEIKIPQVGRIAIIRDPLGAVLSLFEPQMA